MRLKHRVRDPDIADDDALLPGPIIIVPASKAPDPVPAAAPASGRDGPWRVVYGVGGAALAIALTLGVQAWLDRTPARPAAPPRAAAPMVATLPPEQAAPRVDVAPSEPAKVEATATGAESLPATSSPAERDASTLRDPVPAPPIASTPAPAEIPLPAVAVLAEAPAMDDGELAESAGETVLAGDDAPGATGTPVRLASNDLPLTTAAPSVAGAWYHMDLRTRLADSMVVVLHADGRATAHEQRWALQQRGWQPERTSREGRWVVRESAGPMTELCVTWSRPAADEACAIVQESATGMRMEFAGRYWRRAACVEPSAMDLRLPVQVRAAESSSPATTGD